MRHLLALLPLALAAQTTITPPQMKWGAPDAADQLRLFAVGLDKMVQVHVGPGLRIELREGVPTLVAAPVSMVRRRARLFRDGNGNYPGPPTAEIYRNGLLQLEGEDYQVNAGGILPGSPWPASDIVVAVYFEAGPSPVARAAIPCSSWWRAPGCCESLSDVKDCPAFDGLDPSQFARLPTMARAAQVRNWEQLSVRGVTSERRSGTLVALDQLREGRWLLAPAREPAPQCRWTMEVSDGAARLRCW